MKHAVDRQGRCLIGAVAMLSLMAPAYAASGDSKPKNPPRQEPASQVSGQNAEIQVLKQQVAEQQKQIEQMRLLLLDEKKEIEKVNKGAGEKTETPAVPGPGASAPAYAGAGEVASATPVVPQGPVPAPEPLPQASGQAVSPLQVHVGDATITPVGFMDMTNTWRSTNSGASLATNFGNFPYSNTVQGHLTEDRMSAQNSRLGLRVDATVKGAHVLGYYEGDFVGLAPANSQVTSNSMSYRLRLYWINVRKGFWEVQAGQSW
ncbi:MAG TPA: hypothetical protein VFW83_04480, partial [Bryobacteraceae bacterium]|nr:hypothetical protein [Bryobacteraceae bacterium]